MRRFLFTGRAPKSSWKQGPAVVCFSATEGGDRRCDRRALNASSARHRRVLGCPEPFNLQPLFPSDNLDFRDPTYTGSLVTW